MQLKSFLKLSLIAWLSWASLSGFATDGKQKNKKIKLKSYGEKITKENAVDVRELANYMQGQESGTFKITGKIQEVCKVKGCWLTADLGDGKSMRMTFKDYGFFVPKDAHNKTFYAEGEAKYKVTTVEMLRHFAEDAGKSEEEIAQITEPKKELVFVAKGVLIE